LALSRKEVWVLFQDRFGLLDGKGLHLSFGVNGHEDDGALWSDRKVEDPKAARLASLLIFCSDPYLSNFSSKAGDGLAEKRIAADGVAKRPDGFRKRRIFLGEPF
jgi:hypothetical protein